MLSNSPGYTVRYKGMCGKDCPVINPVVISKHPSLLHQLIEKAWEVIVCCSIFVSYSYEINDA